VHPLFDPTKFASDIDYEAFYEPAVLATRLVNSPQSLQHDYCNYFGKTVPAATPSGFSYEDGPRLLPYQYACDKAIGELSRADIRDVEKQRLLLADRITFEVDDIPPYGHCEHFNPNATSEPHSIIVISRDVYNNALTKSTTPEQNARINLQVACILIHEVAHAAHFRLLGPVQEDYREDSHIAEAGFEAVSRIFGLTPSISDWYQQGWAGWRTWQHQKIGHDSHNYDLTTIGRKEWQLPAKAVEVRMTTEFYMKLSDDNFWAGEYLERGALALLPHWLPAMSQPEFKDTWIYKAIPLSLRDLFRTEGLSYAKKKYTRYSNPDRQLRTRPEYDYRFKEGFKS
jgi:hypothetical protein